MDAIILDLLKTWGPPAIVSVVLLYFIRQSERREEAKDTRIQLLENLLIESYGERIEAADRMSDAMHSSATAIAALTVKVDVLIESRVRR